MHVLCNTSPMLDCVFLRSGSRLFVLTALAISIGGGCVCGAPPTSGAELFSIGAISGDTSEGGAQATFTVSLAVEPASDVTISLSSSNPAEGVVTPSSLTFTRENWGSIQRVTVTGVDDDLADGPQQYEIRFSETQSEREDWTGLVAPPVKVTNTDDDSAGFTLEVTDDSTTEAGEQGAFRLALNSQPSADVTVQFASTDPSEGTVAVAQLTFTPVNWKAPQVVQVTGVDDDEADGEQAFGITFAETLSADPGYASIRPEDALLKNVDNDTAGFVVSAATGSTSEAGVQATFTIVLTSKPTEQVELQVSSTDPGEGTPGTSALVFTPVNWNAPQTITVTGHDDSLADGEQPYAITFSAATSADPSYSGLVPADAPFTNLDDETAGITVSAISGPTTENGGQATFSIVLQSEPYADVTVNFASNNAAEGTTSVGSFTFTAQNWNAPRTVVVTGVDDDLADGNQPYAIAFSATTSTDAAYAAITPMNVVVTNTDDDSAGITVSAISGPTTENGGQATFSVVLHSQPYADVTVNFASNTTAEGTLSLGSLTFTAQNWSAPQTVTVTGVNDDFADGNQPYAIVFSSTTSTDAAYAAITPANVVVSNTDNDSAGITVSTISGPTTENGGQATFSIVLTSKPYADVTVNFASNRTSEGTLTVNSLTFTAQNWNAPQTVFVTGVNDDYADGNQPYAVVFSATTSTDAAYAAITPANVTLSNTDNDSAGITVSFISGPTTEAGGQASFTVVLTSQPYADVIVNFASNDSGEGTLTVNSLTFTAQNWNAPQTVTLTGVDDEFADGNQPYAIVFFSTTSTDATYAAITPADVTLTNTDDDSAGIAVSAVSGRTTEAGGQATFTVVLNSEPFADVTVSLASDDLTEGTVAVGSLTFTAENWSTPQTVMVSGVDDAISDGPQTYSIVFSAVASADPSYAALALPSVVLSNLDDDVTVLVFHDAGDSAADEAVLALGYQVTYTTSEAAFNAAFDAGGFGAIIWDSPGSGLPSGAAARLTSWINAGGRLIFDYWSLNSAPSMMAALGVSTSTYDGWRPVYSNPASPVDLFNYFENVPSPLTGTDQAGDNGDALGLTGPGFIAATLDSPSGPGAIAVTHANRVVVNGFLFWDARGYDVDADGVQDRSGTADERAGLRSGQLSPTRSLRIFGTGAATAPGLPAAS